MVNQIQSFAESLDESECVGQQYVFKLKFLPEQISFTEAFLRFVQFVFSRMSRRRLKCCVDRVTWRFKKTTLTSSCDGERQHPVLVLSTFPGKFLCPWIKLKKKTPDLRFVHLKEAKITLTSAPFLFHGTVGSALPLDSHLNLHHHLPFHHFLDKLHSEDSRTSSSFFLFSSGFPFYVCLTAFIPTTQRATNQMSTDCCSVKMDLIWTFYSNNGPLLSCLLFYFSITMLWPVAFPI